VFDCVPACTCEVSYRPVSLFPIRLPLDCQVPSSQPVKLGDGPRYTNTFLPPERCRANRGEPPPQPPTVGLKSVLNVDRSANVVPAGSVKVIPLKSFAGLASVKSETSRTSDCSRDRAAEERRGDAGCRGRTHRATGDGSGGGEEHESPSHRAKPPVSIRTSYFPDVVCGCAKVISIV
jgi:hypothetical protein